MNSSHTSEELTDINMRKTCESLFQFQFFWKNVQQLSKCENNYFKILPQILPTIMLTLISNKK